MKKRAFKSSRESNESKQQSSDQLATLSTQIEPKVPDDERIRAVLRELRLKNINLDAGLERLERLIHSDEPESRKFIEQIKQQSKIGRKDIRVELEIERCKLHVVPLIAEKIGRHQKLIFGAVNFQDGNFPDLYVSGDCSSLAIVGPRGIKKR
ncbi:hypothetical protein M3Y95_01119300 [Aphelenchoides besseyi]|nr:hypothetical protein M3Y95_01119300 [Aphelenchoides besseyi]